MFSTHSFDFFVEKTLKRVCTQLIVSKILTCYDKNENGRVLFIFSQGGTDHATVEKVYVGGPILGHRSAGGESQSRSGQRPGRKDRCQACRCGRHRRRPCRSGGGCHRGKGEKRRQNSFFPKEGQENFLSLFYFSLFYTMRWYICATWANFSVPARQSSILFIPAFRFCPPDAWQRCGQTPPHIPPGPRPHGAPGHIPTGYCQW